MHKEGRMRLLLSLCFFSLIHLTLLAQDKAGPIDLYDDNEEYVEEQIDEKAEAAAEKKAIEDLAKIKENKVEKSVMDDPEMKQILGDLERKNKELLKEAQKLMDSGKLNPSNILKMLQGSKLFKENHNRSQTMKETLLPFRNMSKAQLKKQIFSQSNGSILGEKIKQFPKIGDLIVNMLQDKHAIPSFFTISEKKFLGTVYISFIIFSFILGHILKRKANKKNLSFSKSLISTMTRIFFLMVLRSGFFIYLFREQLDPTYQVIKRSFFS